MKLSEVARAATFELSNRRRWSYRGLGLSSARLEWPRRNRLLLNNLWGCQRAFTGFCFKNSLSRSFSSCQYQSRWPKATTHLARVSLFCMATAKSIGWDRTPIRRKQHRRATKRPPRNFSISPILTVYLVTLITMHYYTTPNRCSPEIILADSLIVYAVATSAIQKIAQHSPRVDCLYDNWNKYMHALNGNIPQTTPPRRLCLNNLIPDTAQRAIPRPEPTLSTNHLAPSPPTHLPEFKLSRNFLLSCRPATQTDLSVPALENLPIIKSTPKYRSGRRVGRFSRATSAKTFYHSRPPRHFKGTRQDRRSPTHFSNSNLAPNVKPTPPPGGTPGSASAESKECTALTVPTRFLSSGRGARVRRERRRQFRRWRQLVKGTIQPKAPDNALVRGQLSLKAVKGYRRKGVRTAKIFKNLVLRPQEEKHANKVHKPLLATPPLPYGHKFRFGTQNAQGMAEALKHQAALDLLKRRSLDVLFLTETHSTSYYNYHMVIVNGSKKDKYGGVTAIVHPAILPFLKDVTQHSSRILQLTFSVSSGDMHLFGVYAPHNKLDFEKVKFPFWETLASITSRIPLPEPTYILGDFNVRLQGRRTGEQHILGPHVYGKGPLSIDNHDTGNRFLYTQFLDHHAFVDTLTFKQPNLLKHITYRDKNPPPKHGPHSPSIL